MSGELKPKDKQNFLEELKLCTQILQHHDTMYWNRFNSYISLLTVFLAFLGALYVVFFDSILTEDDDYYTLSVIGLAYANLFLAILSIA